MLYENLGMDYKTIDTLSERQWFPSVKAFERDPGIWVKYKYKYAEYSNFSPVMTSEDLL